MSHDEGRVCLCVVDHRPDPLELNRHHILPLAAGGGDEPENVVWICPSAHTNVHEILREIVRRRGDLTWRAALDHWKQPVSHYAYALAHEGYRRLVAATTEEKP